MKYIQFCEVMLYVLLLNAMPEYQWQILKKKFGQKFALSVLFLDLKFCKNLGISLSEHCE